MRYPITKYPRLGQYPHEASKKELRGYIEDLTEYLQNSEKELRERILDISCGRKPNRTECWTIKEILGEP